MAAIDPILVARDRLCEEFARLDKLVRDQARDDAVCRRLMTVPGVGAVVALSYVAAVDDPARFAKPKAVSPALGPRSGARDDDPRNWFLSKAWAMRVAARPRRQTRQGHARTQARGDPAPHLVDGTEFQAQPA